MFIWFVISLGVATCWPNVAEGVYSPASTPTTESTPHSTTLPVVIGDIGAFLLEANDNSTSSTALFPPISFDALDLSAIIPAFLLARMSVASQLQHFHHLLLLRAIPARAPPTLTFA